MVVEQTALGRSIAQGRVTERIFAGDPRLGHLSNLPGIWSNDGSAHGLPAFPGRGWNLVALPNTGLADNFFLLVNQYDEELQFGPDLTGPVPNRGNPRDQHIFALRYSQSIKQRAAAVSPIPPAGGPPLGAGEPIHLEPGLFLNIADEVDPNLDLARLATVPHGNNVLALGRAQLQVGMPDRSAAIAISGSPMGISQGSDSSYLAPYRETFLGIFSPLRPAALLEGVVDPASVVRTTVLDFDTRNPASGILNIPFLIAHANATETRSIFWVMELEPHQGNPVFILQYLQVVMLEFHPRTDGKPGLIRWPHVSINTLVRHPLSA